ncbi:hypothetical protein BDQ17DRAFT_1328691 [Cyathus striatus]|nr:hypothetical protein BDQ17DRAFT_1328691 [Cyathus striatus]
MLFTLATLLSAALATMGNPVDSSRNFTCQTNGVIATTASDSLCASSTPVSSAPVSVSSPVAFTWAELADGGFIDMSFVGGNCMQTSGFWILSLSARVSKHENIDLDDPYVCSGAQWTSGSA